MKLKASLIMSTLFITFALIMVVMLNATTNKTNDHEAYDSEFNPRNFLESALANDINRVKSFLDRGMNPNVTDDDGRTALFITVRHQYVDMVKLLLNAKADPNIKDFYDDSPLKIAKELGNKELIDLLIQKGAED